MTLLPHVLSVGPSSQVFTSQCRVNLADRYQGFSGRHLQQHYLPGHPPANLGLPIQDGRQTFQSGCAPEAFGPDTVIFTKTGAAPASSAQGSVPGGSGIFNQECTAGLYGGRGIDRAILPPDFRRSVYAATRRRPVGVSQGPRSSLRAGANHLRELSGISGPLEDLQGKLLLKVATPKGHQSTYSGKSRRSGPAKHGSCPSSPGLLSTKTRPWEPDFQLTAGTYTQPINLIRSKKSATSSLPQPMPCKNLSKPGNQTVPRFPPAPLRRLKCQPPPQHPQRQPPQAR